MIKKIEANWPGWRVVQKIGVGGYGAVYEIERDVFDRVEKAALKVISIPQSEEEIRELYNEGYNDESVTEHFKSYLEDIVKEYSFMLDMKGHKNVVYCDDLRYVQHEDGIGWDIYIRMELLTPLTKILSKSFDEEEVIRIGADIANALVMCKNRNIVHRDIKPQNIFISNMGDYKLGDFGVAKISEKTQSGTKIGTFEYMPPEIYKGMPYGTSADVYSLGLVLYWLLNDKRGPFVEITDHVPTINEKMQARMRRLNGEKLPEPANGSKALKAIVLKACAYELSDRYFSASELLDDLCSLKLKLQNGSLPNAVAAESQSKAIAKEETPSVIPEIPPVANVGRTAVKEAPPKGDGIPPVMKGNKPDGGEPFGIYKEPFTPVAHGKAVKEQTSAPASENKFQALSYDTTENLEAELQCEKTTCVASAMAEVVKNEVKDTSKVQTPNNSQSVAEILANASISHKPKAKKGSVLPLFITLAAVLALICGVVLAIFLLGSVWKVENINDKLCFSDDGKGPISFYLNDKNADSHEENFKIDYVLDQYKR